MQQHEIVQTALREFGKLTGVTIGEVPLGTLSKNQKFVLDARVRLKVGKEVAEFKAEVKNELRQAQLPKLLDQFQNKKEDWLLISQYIPKPLKDELKSLGINYLEASGNCFIRYKSMFFYINDQAVTPSRLKGEGKLWKSTGLKFLFLLLQKPEMINSSYRLLAKGSKIALGNVGPFIEELIKEGYVKEKNDGTLFFEFREQLVKKWGELFVSNLRPKLRLGSYVFFSEEKWKNWTTLSTNHFYWGGEAAGALLTNYLNPEKLTMYTSHQRGQLIKEFALMPKTDGYLEIMEVFWNEEEFNDTKIECKTVPPLLAYAELATSLDSRNRETAERIKQNYLEH